MKIQFGSFAILSPYHCYPLVCLIPHATTPKHRLASWDLPHFHLHLSQTIATCASRTFELCFLFIDPPQVHQLGIYYIQSVFTSSNSAFLLCVRLHCTSRSFRYTEIRTSRVFSLYKRDINFLLRIIAPFSCVSLF